MTEHSVRKSWWRTIRGRILIWLAAAVLIPLGFSIYDGYRCAREAIMEIQEKHLQSLLELKKSRLEAWLADVEADLQLLAIESCTKSGCGKSCLPVMNTLLEGGCLRQRDFRARIQHYECVVNFDTKWNPLGDGEKCVQPIFRSLLPLLKKSLSNPGNFAVTPPAVHAPGRICMLAGCPVITETGENGGYIVACLNLTKAVDPIVQEPEGLGRTGRVHLLAPDGRFITTPRLRPALRGQMCHWPSNRLDRQVYEYRNYLDRPVLGAATNLPATGWRILVEQDTAEVFHWLAILKQRAGFTASLTLLGVLILTWIAAWQLSRPLRQMAEVARNISRGQVQERMPPMTGREEGEVAGAFNGMLDELAASQQRLIQAASLAAIGELSSSIAHEIRNPLCSVKLNLQAFRAKLGDNPSYLELADIALGQCARIERMLSELLNYAKPLELHKEHLLFKDLAAEALPGMEDAIKEKEIRLDFHDDTAGQPFPADREQLRRVLANLIGNAVHAVPPGGCIRVTGRRLQSDGHHMIIDVADDGPGVPDHLKETIFQPFYSGRQGGTGLGLSNVRKIVAAHGGRVTVEGRPPAGAVFSVCLPVNGPAS